ncbi:ParB N-terminal domain-containing protein [uncultured Phenylobacterium sp.]|uniref:ParB N-terminal domain-containing protein n=1 Tax=uncultured Phenylobacterium sp. TaxID=349273 RepID=UPI0025F3AEC8|nr:ParB N-terminal domain-containing protein [uncultured Phenylobacterium sp.]
MSANASTVETLPARLPKLFALRDLGVAPENMRFSEPADDGVPELAETIFAAGVLQPLTVRPGKRKEKPGMALDGRRRLLALELLRDAGRITDDYPVEAFVETDPARQAAAVVLTNTAVPVHVADIIVAIGKMSKAKLTPTVIAGALGYAEVDIRRLAALAELHPKAIEALKGGRITLRQARLLARLPNRKEQGEIAEAAMNGFGFQEWRVTDRLNAGQVTVRDRRFRLVGADRYAAAGGSRPTSSANGLTWCSIRRSCRRRGWRAPRGWRRRSPPTAYMSRSPWRRPRSTIRRWRRSATPTGWAWTPRGSPPGKTRRTPSKRPRRPSRTSTGRRTTLIPSSPPTCRRRWRRTSPANPRET